MGAYAYCRKCGQGLNAPIVKEAALDCWECPNCSTHHELYRNALANALESLEERIAALEQRSNLKGEL